MKVLLINGSPRKNGNTFTALSEIADTLKTEGFDSEIVWIGNKPIRGCIACGTCKTKNNGRCVFDDDVCNSISTKFAEADGFVFGSPVYYGQPNGALLSIMQRAFFSNGANVQNKPAAVVTICRRGGATAAFEALRHSQHRSIGILLMVANKAKWHKTPRACRLCERSHIT